MNDLVIVSREVAGQLAALGVETNLAVADACGEAPRAPRWAFEAWEAIKYGLIDPDHCDFHESGLVTTLVTRGLVTTLVTRFFRLMLNSDEYRNHVSVIIACLDSPLDRVKAIFDFAAEGTSVFCPCGQRLSSFEQIRRAKCNLCENITRFYAEIER